MTSFKVDLKKSILELLMIFLAISISFFIEEWRQDNQLKSRLIEDYYAILRDLDEANKETSKNKADPGAILPAAAVNK